MPDEEYNPFLMEWNGIKIYHNRDSIKRGDKIFTEEDIKNIAETEFKEKLQDPKQCTGTGGVAQAAIWAQNKSKIIAHLLNCNENDLQYVELPHQMYEKKTGVYIHYKVEVILYYQGVLISQWSGGDFGDIHLYFVTQK